MKKPVFINIFTGRELFFEGQEMYRKIKWVKCSYFDGEQKKQLSWPKEPFLKLHILHIWKQKR